MYQKVRNTLASLAVAMSMLGVSYSIGRPPMEATPQVNFAAPGIEANLGELQSIRKRNRGMQSQLSMPFFSFAPLLPRRES
jgi:hypothetical protein